MTRRAVRLALFLSFLVTVALSGWAALDITRRLEADRLATQSFDTSARSVLRTIGEARSAVQAYVAVGQGDEQWRTRALEAIERLKQDLGTLRQSAVDSAALNDLDAAVAAIDGFSGLNDRAARLARNGQLTDASAAIFGEGLESLATAAEATERARDVEYAASTRTVQFLYQKLAYLALLAAGVGLLVVLMLLPRVRKEDAGDVTTPSTPVVADTLEPPVADSVPLRRAAVTVEPEPVAAAHSASTPDSLRRPDRRKGTELRAMAELCTDFARLTDPSELTGLLERAARLIDASGFIVWVADSTGAALRPAVAHGYSTQALSRLPAIPRAADNATAAAYREIQIQVVRTNGTTPGALVVPLVTVGGCVGVLTAEVRHGRESSESIQALTRIVASQLATIVSVASPGIADESPVNELRASEGQ